MAARIELSGDCSVTRAEELRATLLEALQAGGDIEIDLSGVTAIDLTFCQIIHALRLSCQARGVALAVLGALPEAVSAQALFCGINDLAGLPGPETHAGATP